MHGIGSAAGAAAVIVLGGDDPNVAEITAAASGCPDSQPHGGINA